MCFEVFEMKVNKYRTVKDILNLKKEKYSRFSEMKEDVADIACNLILNQLKYDTKPTKTVLIDAFWFYKINLQIFPAKYNN